MPFFFIRFAARSIIVVRKNLSLAQGRRVLFPDERYFFYLTNDWQTPAEKLVLKANGRCHQENLIEQLKNEVHALRAPLDTLESNWAYMVIASLAWTLKIWSALLLPEAFFGATEVIRPTGLFHVLVAPAIVPLVPVV